MSFFDNRRRRALSRIIEDLQRLQDDPERLARVRDQRYSESPPPYQSSGETTQPDSPGEPDVVEESTPQVQRYEPSPYNSTPRAQFDAQAMRESERINYQWSEERFGRRQTLPYDETQDFTANAENNVRARWIEQGIWKEEWGPPWGKGAKPSVNRWKYGSRRRKGPQIDGLARWAHEKNIVQAVPPKFEQKPTPAPEPQPASTANGFTFQFPSNPSPPTANRAELTAPPKQVPTDPLTLWEPDSQTESETESVPEDAPIPEPDDRTKSIFPGWKRMALEARAENKIRRAEKRKLRAEGRENRRREAAAAAARYRLNPEASRPNHQFLYQISTEREWIRDELLYKHSTGIIDIDAMAYEAVKKSWIEDKIWNPEWDEVPGMTWMHEDIYDKKTETLTGIKEGCQKSPSLPRAVGSGSQQPYLPSPGALSAEETTGLGEPTHDHGLPSAPADGDILRSVRSSRVKKPSEPKSASTKSRRKQNYRSTRSGGTSGIQRYNNAQGTSQNQIEDSSLASSDRSKSGMLNGSGHANRHATEHQPSVAASEPRRSARIADMQQKKRAFEPPPKGEMVSKRKRNKAAPHEANELSKPKRRKLVQDAMKGKPKPTRRKLD